jgi:hypothetical protein
MDAVWAVGNREEGKKFNQWSVWRRRKNRPAGWYHRMLAANLPNIENMNPGRFRAKLCRYETAGHFITWNNRGRDRYAVSSGIDPAPGAIEYRAKEANRRSSNANS